MGSFDIHIELGHEFMQTPEDVATALRRVANLLDNGRTEGNIYDLNGNFVGTFKMTPGA